MPRIPLVIGKMDLESDQTRSNDAVAAHLINGFRVGDALHMWPDHAEYCDLGHAGADVYVWYSVLHGVHYAVCAGNLYRIDGEGLFTAINGATLLPGVKPAFTEDRHNVFVAAASPIHRISGDTATAIAGGQAPVNVTSLAFVSGFLVANGDDPAGGGLAGDFAYSDTQGEDGVPTYEVWGYENNASKPDGLQAIMATPDDNVYFIGSESVDVAYISGDVNNPFAANKAAAQTFGTPARYSVAHDSQSGYFLSVIAGNRQIVRLVGGREPQVIGFPVGVPVQDVDRVDNARAYMSGHRGQSFYIITFPTANIHIEGEFYPSLTLAFNVRTEEWAILGDWDAVNGQYNAYSGVSFAYDQSTRFVGGSDGKIYRFTGETRAAEPVMHHRWRNDGNMTWTNPRSVSLGRLGQRQVPANSRMCGKYHKRQDEFIFSNGGTRMAILTAWRNWGRLTLKKSLSYAYDIKRGDEGVVFNAVEETVV